MQKRAEQKPEDSHQYRRSQEIAGKLAVASEDRPIGPKKDVNRPGEKEVRTIADPPQQ